MAFDAKADIVMLDNMDLETMRKAIPFINKQCQTEVTGGITIEKAKELSDLGIDRISVGALTHSVTALDFSMKLE